MSDLFGEPFEATSTRKIHDLIDDSIAELNRSHASHQEAVCMAMHLGQRFDKRDALRIEFTYPEFSTERDPATNTMTMVVETGWVAWSVLTEEVSHHGTGTLQVRSVR